MDRLTTAVSFAQCPMCTYNLTGLSAQTLHCPECGFELDSTIIAAAGPVLSHEGLMGAVFTLVFLLLMVVASLWGQPHAVVLIFPGLLIITGLSYRAMIPWLRQCVDVLPQQRLVVTYTELIWTPWRSPKRRFPLHEIGDVRLELSATGPTKITITRRFMGLIPRDVIRAAVDLSPAEAVRLYEVLLDRPEMAQNPAAQGVCGPVEASQNAGKPGRNPA